MKKVQQQPLAFELMINLSTALQQIRSWAWEAHSWGFADISFHRSFTFAKVKDTSFHLQTNKFLLSHKLTKRGTWISWTRKGSPMTQIFL